MNYPAIKENLLILQYFIKNNSMDLHLFRTENGSNVEIVETATFESDGLFDVAEIVSYSNQLSAGVSLELVSSNRDRILLHCENKECYIPDAGLQGIDLVCEKYRNLLVLNNTNSRIVLGQLSEISGYFINGLFLKTCNWSGRVFKNCTFVDFDLQNCNFSNCKFYNCIFSGSGNSCDISMCNLSYTEFHDCSLNIFFSYCDMTHINLVSTSIHKGYIRLCKPSGASFCCVKVYGTWAGNLTVYEPVTGLDTIMYTAGGATDEEISIMEKRFLECLKNENTREDFMKRGIVIKPYWGFEVGETIYIRETNLTFISCFDVYKTEDISSFVVTTWDTEMLNECVKLE